MQTAVKTVSTTVRQKGVIRTLASPLPVTGVQHTSL